MKLYTEEQVREAIDLARVILNDGSPYPKYIILSEIKGIELPSDEGIYEGIKHILLNKENRMSFIDGAKWMKEQILGKEDKTFKQKSKWTKL